MVPPYNPQHQTNMKKKTLTQCEKESKAIVAVLLTLFSIYGLGAISLFAYYILFR